MKSFEKLADILRTDKDNLRVIEENLGFLTGKKNVLDKIIEENDFFINDLLKSLGLDRQSSAKEIYGALISKMEADNNALFEFLGKPSTNSSKDWQRVLLFAFELSGKPKGFFLKIEKAAGLLKSCPPLNVLKTLGYNSIEEMLKNEDIFEIYSSLRFIEG